jgi:hypothetical protein
MAQQRERQLFTTAFEQAVMRGAQRLARQRPPQLGEHVGFPGATKIYTVSGISPKGTATLDSNSIEGGKRQQLSVRVPLTEVFRLEDMDTVYADMRQTAPFN